MNNTDVVPVIPLHGLRFRPPSVTCQGPLWFIGTTL